MTVFCNYESKWQWDFVMSDGSRSTPATPSSVLTYKDYSTQKQQVKSIKVMFNKGNFYGGCLVALELTDFAGRVILSTKLFDKYTKDEDYCVKEFELENYEHIVGIKSRRVQSCHYDVQFIIGRLE